MPLKMVNVTGEALVTWLTSREWGVAACYQCLNLDMSVSQPSGMPSFAILNACQNSLWATESLTSLSENKFRDRLWSFLLEQKKLSQIIPSMARISKSWKMHNSETIIGRHPYWTSAKVSWFSDVLLLCLHFTQPITAVRRVRKISIFFNPCPLPLEVLYGWSFEDDIFKWPWSPKGWISYLHSHAKKEYRMCAWKFTRKGRIWPCSSMLPDRPI